MDARERLIISLDVPTVAQAQAIVETIGEDGVFYKIGYQLAFAGGLEFARALSDSGKKIFLDMKLLDIDNTIASAVENIVKLGVSMLTIHAYPKAMRAAVKAADGSGLTLLGVTVLTSMDDADLAEAGYRDNARALVLERALQARDAKMGGIVCSAEESAIVRASVGDGMAVVTPGIRPLGSDAGDQKRVLTPYDAIRAGSSHLVVGRPIVKAADPKAATKAILEDIDKAL